MTRYLAGMFTTAAVASMAGLFLAATPASAQSLAVQLACASDFYSLCSRHDPDSAGARSCMRSNGNKLSQRCVNALIAAGEVSKSEVTRRASLRK